MQKIVLQNENASVISSQIINEVSKIIEDNTDVVVSKDKKIVTIPNTKGELLTTIILTIGTSVVADMISLLVQKAIEKLIKKPEIRISIDTDGKKISVHSDVEFDEISISIQIQDHQ